MHAVLDQFVLIAPRAGLTLLSLIFLANALGVVDQRVAVRELAATGVPPRKALMEISAGRIVQLLGPPCLFFAVTRPFAALVLAVFMVEATLVAHPFWKAAPADRDRQVVNFLKNTAIVGGLLVAAGWRG